MIKSHDNQINYGALHTQIPLHAFTKSYVRRFDKCTLISEKHFEMTEGNLDNAAAGYRGARLK